MNLDDARRYARELAADLPLSFADTPREGKLEEAVLVLGAEVERLQAIEARARTVAFHDGPLWSVPAPELHWIGQHILKGDGGPL